MSGIVIADTGPLNYLLLIDHIELLPRLFEAVHIPDAVRTELSDGAAPQIVRDWIAAPPFWLQIRSTSTAAISSPKLDVGEQAAIALAIELKATLLLIDDRTAAAAARAQGFVVTGTLGVLSRAATLGMADLPLALTRLTATNFRIHRRLIEELLANHSQGR